MNDLIEEIQNIIFNFIEFKPCTKKELKTAVDLWCGTELEKASALATYGNINEWNVSQITDMSQLFRSKSSFNDDISNWDVSSVTNMDYMFYYNRRLILVTLSEFLYMD